MEVVSPHRGQRAVATSIGRRLLLPTFAGALLLAAGAGSVFAKCEGPNPPAFCSQVTVSIDAGSAGAIYRAGEQTSIRIFLSKAEGAYDPQRLSLTFTRQADDSMVTALATATTLPGLWQADVTLPGDGSWTVVANVVEAQGSTSRISIEPIQVAAPRAQPPISTPAPPVTPSSPALPIAIALAALAALGLAAVGLRQRARRGTAGGLAAASRSERPG